jgi:signal transduction histidine kinase
LNNAITYNDKAAGTIEIGFEDSAEFWNFSVTDNGKGIKKEYHQKIFDVFQSLGDNPSSTGIGLSIVKKVVQNHKGSISLESEPDKGTTFYFSIKKQIS